MKQLKWIHQIFSLKKNKKPSGACYVKIELDQAQKEIFPFRGLQLPKTFSSRNLGIALKYST
jgi:hypothetical protein